MVRYADSVLICGAVTTFQRGLRCGLRIRESFCGAARSENVDRGEHYGARKNEVEDFCTCQMANTGWTHCSLRPALPVSQRRGDVIIGSVLCHCQTKETDCAGFLWWTDQHSYSRAPTFLMFFK